MFDHQPPPASLPPSAQAKLQAMLEQRQDGFAVANAAAERMREASTQREHLRRELERLEESGIRGATMKATIERARAVWEAAKAELDRRNQRYVDLAAEAQKTAGCHGDVTAWLEKHKGADFRPFAGTVSLPLKRGETAEAAVERVRGEIADRKAELHRIASAPIASTEAKAAIRREIEMLAEHGAPDVGRVLEGGSIRWPTHILRNHPGEIVNTNTFDARAVLTWLHKPALLARLEAEVDAIADEKAALSADQRRTEDARVRTELLMLEREEEALIESAGPHGRIWRRRDADPRAVLGLAETVPGYEFD